MASGNQTAVDHSTWLSLNDLVVGNTDEKGALIPPEEAFPRSIRHHVRRRSPTLDELIAEAIPYSPNSSVGGGGPSRTLAQANQKELGVATNLETKQELLEAARAVEERLNFSSNAKKKNLESLSKMSVYQPHRRAGARAQNTRHPSGQTKKRPPLTTDVVKKIRNKILAGGSTARGFCNLAQVFKAADMDRDGYLSMMEWEHLVCKRGVHIAPDIANRLFKKLDTKHSGLMDFDQFSTFMEMDGAIPGAVAAKRTVNAASSGEKKGGRISPPTIVSTKTPQEVALEREISRLNSKLSKKATHAKSRKKPPPFFTGSSRAEARLAKPLAKNADAGRAKMLTKDYTASARSKTVTTAASPTSRARAPTAPTRVDGPAPSGTNVYSLDHNIEHLLQRARENPSPNLDNIINYSTSKDTKEEEEEEMDMVPPVLNERQSQLLNLTRARGDTLPLGPSEAPAPASQQPPPPPPPPTAPAEANREIDDAPSARSQVMTEADCLELQLLRRQNVEKDRLLNEYQEEKKKLTDRLHAARMDHLDLKTTSPIGVVGYIPSHEAMVGYRTRNGNVVDSVQTSRDLELALAETSMKMERMADELRRLKVFESNASVQLQYATARNRETVQQEMDALRQENERLKADLSRRDKELQQSRADLARATAKLRHHARRASMPTNHAGVSSFVDRRRASVTAPKSTPDVTSVPGGTVDAVPRPGSYVEKFKNKQNRALNARHGRADSAPLKVAANPKYRKVAQTLETILDRDHGDDTEDGSGGDYVKNQGERGAPDALEAAVAKRKKSIEALKQSNARPNDPDSSNGEEDDDFDRLPPPGSPDLSEADNRNDAFFKDMKRAKEVKAEQEQRELDEKINNMTEQERQAFEAGERETKEQKKKQERHLQILAKANGGKAKKKQIGGGRGKNRRIPKVQTPSNLLHLPRSPPMAEQSNPSNDEAMLPSPPPAYDSSDEDEDEGVPSQDPAVTKSPDDELSRNAQFSVVPKPPLPPPLPDDIDISTPETSFRGVRSSSQESDIPPPPRMPAPTMDTLDNFDDSTDGDDTDFTPPPGAPPAIILPPSLPPPDLTNSPAVDRYEI